MIAMILTPDQARAVVGEGDPTHWFTVVRASDGENSIVARPLARFVPAATADAWPIDEWVEVEVFATYVLDGIERPTVVKFGRVRLGEPVWVWAHLNGSAPIIAARAGRLELRRATDDAVVDITHPHLDLFPDDWQPGSWAHPITERSA